jgi:hypothetical protein
MSQLWYNIYLPLVISGQMTLAQLDTAKTKGRITQVEYNDLVSHIPA